MKGFASLIRSSRKLFLLHSIRKQVRSRKRVRPEPQVSDATHRSNDSVKPLSDHSTTQQQTTQTSPYSTCGLINMGNTCYMNAAIQVVLHTPHFNTTLMQGPPSLHPSHKGVALAYLKLTRVMRQAQKTQLILPKELKFVVSRAASKFRGFGQEDSQEFLRTLLDLLHQDLNRVRTRVPYKELKADLSVSSLTAINKEWSEYFNSRENSVVSDLFQGQLLSTVECQLCRHQSVAFDNFQELSVSLPCSPGVVRIEELLSEFFRGELLINCYNCEKCRRTSKAIKKFSLWKAPRLLIIHLKRFQFGRYTRGKIETIISFPLRGFDVSKYRGSAVPTYELYGLIHHYGSLSFGHYTAECKNQSDGRWYSLNDESVFPIEIQGKEYETRGSKSPYVLLYKQRDNM